MIIEDDFYLCEELMHTFTQKGYSTLSISSFHESEQEILKANPDLAILDLNLPNKSGFELCKWLKAHSSFPILILTARDTLSDELKALGLGADDFLTKPCHPERLIARAERLLQTYGKLHNFVQVGDLILDIDTYKVIWQNSSAILPETSGKILKTLMEYHPEIVTKEKLTHILWGGNEFVDENILQVNITRLRKNLGLIGLHHLIYTERGQGYRLEVDKH